jgi:hypothetical protein
LDDPAAEDAFRQAMGIDPPFDGPANDQGPSSRVHTSGFTEATLPVDPHDQPLLYADMAMSDAGSDDLTREIYEDS